MEDDIAVRELVEIISAAFDKKKAVEEELTFSLPIEFLRNVQDIIITKQTFFGKNWVDFFCSFCDRMLSSSEMYLAYVIHVCRQVTFVVPKIFEIFITAFALIIRIIAETNSRKKVDYSKLVPDIFMVFYENELKKKFRRSGGFRRFVEYINNPKYLKSSCIWRNVVDCSNLTPSPFQNNVSDKVMSSLFKMQEMLNTINLENVERDHRSLVLAKKVLIKRKDFKPLMTEFLPLHDSSRVNRSDFVIQQLEKVERCLETSEETRDMKETLECCSSLNPDSDVTDLHILKFSQLDSGERILKMAEERRDSEETMECCPSLNLDSVANDESVRQMADNASYEKIIEAVIRHNHSKISVHGKSKGRIQTQTDGILDHLKSTIKTLVEVLDE